ncbi:GntR family transcriptional regulator [Motiliproteus coralliicola]|uniref:GntR family transcriptional regulator n=1 Tax=Motiliproteus coralliicola TaxID=2283196 RepID=A0A369WVS3_9GAMM|nr:amidohydrolase family protein [Motiliproteus coralliicola]RDE24646.1 GntR family transcriptional regulator [Motiliproteus coralliicola]
MKSNSQSQPLHSVAVCAAPNPDLRASDLSVPDRACDCHAHVYTRSGESLLVEPRSYTPALASLEDYRAMLSSQGMSRGVIVQPSVYGTDNSVTLQAVRAAPDKLRAVVTVDDSTSFEQLESLHRQGARGARINLLFAGGGQREQLQTIAESVAEFGWHLQLLIDVSNFADLYSTLEKLPVDLVFDHMGHMPVAKGVNDPGFVQMLRLIGEGKGWAKLSGAYRLTAEQTAPYQDVMPVAKALVDCNPQRLVWGSDWPHPQIPVPMPTEAALLNMLQDWLPEKTLQHQVLVDNPSSLYGFDNA